MRLTQTQALVLRGVRDHGNYGHFARGRAQQGGFTTSAMSLARKGYVTGIFTTQAKLTDLGTEALADHERRNR